MIVVMLCILVGSIHGWYYASSPQTRKYNVTQYVTSDDGILPHISKLLLNVACIHI